MAHARRFVSLLVVAGLAGAALAAGPGAGAEQLGPVTATQDAYVASTAARAGYDTAELRARNGGGQRSQSHLRFDLRAIPAGATGLRATLRLSASPISAAGRVEVRASGSFSEGSVTWASRPATSAVLGSAAVVPGGTFEIDAGPVTGAGFRSYALTSPAGQGAQLRFASSEHPDPAQRPALTVTWAPPGPPVSDKLVPRAGAWWGSYPGQAPGDVEAREAVYGRQVDILHRYHDWNDTWPTAEEQAYAGQGRFLFEGWESRIFGGATLCWADIAAGAHDAAIDAQAASWALYPGDDVVDWVAWDPYNWANCAGRSRDTWRSLQQAAQPMYAHLDAVGNTKPRMLGEYGSHDDPAMGRKEQWLRELPAMLRTAMPKVRAVVYFDRVATPVPGDPCAWLADSSPSAQAGFAAAGADSYLNQPRN